MAGTTSDDDDLSPTHEYFIAGFVILLFGLLYWFFNSSWSDDYASPQPLVAIENTGSIDSAKKGIPVIAASAVTASTVSVVSTTDDISSDTEATKNISKVADMLETDVSKSKPEEEVEEVVVAAEANESSSSIDPEEDQNAQADLPQIVENAEVIESVTEPESPIAESLTQTEPQPKEETEESSDYSLPDGTPMKLAPAGFEYNLEQLFVNNTNNKALIFDQIYFETGSVKLNKKSSRQIRATAALMNAHPEKSVLLRGYTDNKGNAVENIELSLMRANSMGLALGDLGINTERIRILGLGDASPVSKNDTEESRKKNRRIEILLQ